MNYSLIVKTIGKIIMVESGLMVIPFAIALWNRDSMQWAFAFSILFTGIFGFLLSLSKHGTKHLRIIDGMAIVTFGWLFASIFGALPYFFSGLGLSIIDCLFESVSGLSTTGATILQRVEMLPDSLLFWRSFTQWIGGMGILVFTLAFLPALEGGSLNVLKAEAAGVMQEKMVPRVKDNARVLYLTYGVLTILLTLFLTLGGMSWFEALLHAFGTVATAGFSTRSGGIAEFGNPFIPWIISVFMLLAGINFALLVSMVRGRYKRALQNSEFKFYMSAIGIGTLGVTLSLALQGSGIFTALRNGFFLAVSIVTSTGYTTLDINRMPYFSQALLFILMFVGGCVGSTGSGVKAFRGMIIFKLVRREIVKLFHPRSVVPLLVNTKKFNSESIHSVVSFIALYFIMFMFGALVISADNMDLVKSFSASAAALGNVGQSFGFDAVSMNFSSFGTTSKLVLCLLMLVGRLELFTVLALLAPRSWKKGT
jgi:trk system potassium uptake protein TrkH